MARMYYADGSYKDTNGHRTGRSNARAVSYKSSNDTVKWVLLALLIIAAFVCILLVQHNLYTGKHANARTYGNELVCQTDVVAPALSTFTPEQLSAENGLQDFLNASQLAATYSYEKDGTWTITFAKPEWPPLGPKVILSGNSSSHNAQALEVRKFFDQHQVEFQFENEQYTHEVTLGKHTFVLTPSQAKALIGTISVTFDK